MVKTKFDITELEPMASKDSIVLSQKSSSPLTLEEVVRAMTSLDRVIDNCNTAKASLQERLNSFSSDDIDKAFKDKAWSIGGKTYRVVNKQDEKVDFNIKTLESIPEASGYLKTVPAYHKLDQSAYLKALADGTVDPAVSSAITIRTTSSNIIKEVK